MSVTVRLPPVLRATSAVPAPSSSTRRATCAARSSTLVDQYPGLRQKLLDGDGDLNRFVNVYVDRRTSASREGLDTSLRDGATVIVLPAMAGGDR